MFKRFSIILLIVLLTACQNKEADVVVNKKEEIKEYLNPIKDKVLFDEITNPKTKTRIKVANGNKDYQNYQFKMFNKPSYNGELVDINGNVVNLMNIKTYVLEIVSVECSHCKKLITNHMGKMLDSSYPLIQYFNVGNKQDIYDFYSELGIKMPNNAIIVEHDDDMQDYIKNTIQISNYPTLVSYVNNSVTFDSYGELEDIELNEYYNISFKETLTKNELVNAKGEDILSLDWSLEDVEHSFSKENLEKIDGINNDEYTKELVFKLVGSKVNFDVISNDKNDIYVNEIDDYSYYKDKDLVIFYTFFKKDEDFERIKFINELIALHDEYEYIAVLIEGFDTSSKMYRSYDSKLNCKVVSNLGYMPDDFYKVGIANYPTAVFVEKGTFTGGYSNINSIDNYEKALDMFFGENSIALKSNN